MAFKDIRFPPNISFSATGGPGFSTSITEVDSGYEFRNRNWELERSEYEVSHAARLPSAWKPLLSFFRIVGGRANTFRFKDWLDYTATSSEGVFVMLTATTFQCYKRYNFGTNWDSPADNYYLRKITKPVSSISVTGGSGVSVDYSTGVVTVSSGTPTSWAGDFDVHCRFDTDQMKHETIDKAPSGELIVGWQSIPIVEVRD